jgi:hypothetical protein
MMNLFNLKGIYALTLLALCLVSCEANKDELAESNITASNVTASITQSDLVGEWKLSAMNTDTPVNLDDDTDSNTNILLETDCFDTMGVVFKENGNLTTTNSKLDFKAGTNNDDFKCLSGRTDEGQWNVKNENNEERLELTLNINGESYTHSRILDRTENTFAFEVNKMESQEYYGNPDGTDVEEVTVLSLEYTRVN